MMFAELGLPSRRPRAYQKLIHCARLRGLANQTVGQIACYCDTSIRELVLGCRLIEDMKGIFSG